MKQIVKSTFVLVAITLIAGLALAFVYEITKAPIAEAERAARDNAYRMVLSDAETFVAVGTVEAEQYPVDQDGISINECLTATDEDGIFVGHVVNVTTPNGYGGNINMAVGIDPNGAVSGISIISQSETPGLGAACADQKFTDQFIGIEGFVEYVKDGKTEANEIDAISGATITTAAVTEAVNAAKTFVSEIQTGGND